MSLVPLDEDLAQQIKVVQQRRKLLHDATIVEEQPGKGRSPSQPSAPKSMEPPRTVEGPALADLKSPNYPFLLCEEAPPSYIPPPVPFDVEGEVEVLKQRVLAVQKEFVEHEKKLKREGKVAKSSSQRETSEKNAKKSSLSEDQIVEFFSQSHTFAELAWSVSTLIWFYRWVLSHSISHLWNCKEALEFVLQDNNQPLPTTSEEMDAALEQFPFTQAVSILDNDRSATIAQERRRLRTVSRTFKDGLPAIAVTAATSSYLSTEEKYMYQEFFNQSEHLILLLNHAKLLERSQEKSKEKSRSPSAEKSREPSLNAQTGAVMSEEDMLNVRMLTEDAASAMGAEEQVIESLIETIADRKKNNVTFEISPEERERSRTAQIAVYGCVVSDMRLMGEQMSIAAEFLNKYEGWLRFYGLGGHDSLMERLSKITGGNYWPVLPSYGGHPNGHSHSHGGDYGDDFVNPTEVFQQPRKKEEPARLEPPTRNSAEFTSQQKPNPKPQRNSAEREESNPAPSMSASQAKRSPSAANPQEQSTRSAKPQPAEPKKEVQREPKKEESKKEPKPTPTPKPAERRAHQDPVPETTPTASQPTPAQPPIRTFDQPKNPPTFDDNAMATVFFQLLPLVDTQMKLKLPSIDDVKVVRAWQIVCLRYTTLRVIAEEWSATGLVQRIDGIGAALQSKLAENELYSDFKPNVSGLMAVIFLFSSLYKANAKSGQPLLPVEVIVHALFRRDDYKAEVEYTLSAAEADRWGALLDALWVQADSSGAAHGGLLSTSDTPSIKFLRLLSITVQKKSTSKSVLTLQYATADLEDHKTRLFKTVVDCERSVYRRFQLARILLVGFYELETCGMLPCYACRMEEVDAVPFLKILYLSDDRSYMAGILPPGAVQLKRIASHLQERVARQPTEQREAPFSQYIKRPHFSSIGMLLAPVLQFIATAQEPPLTEVVLSADSLKEQSQWEVANKTVPRSFATSTRHPIAVALMKEKPYANRNGISVRRFAGPLLRQLDDTIANLPAELKSSRSQSTYTAGNNSKRNSTF